MVSGGGQYESNATATLTAVPDDCYKFVRWDDGNTDNPRLVVVAGNESYSAVFEPITYVVLWKDVDGTTLETDSILCGTMPNCDGETPTKPATVEYTYIFKGWIPEIVAVTSDTTYIAQFDSVKNMYEVTWVNAEGGELSKDSLEYGAMPDYNGETPKKDSTTVYA